MLVLLFAIVALMYLCFICTIVVLHYYRFIIVSVLSYYQCMLISILLLSVIICLCYCTVSLYHDLKAFDRNKPSHHAAMLCLQLCKRHELTQLRRREDGIFINNNNNNKNMAAGKEGPEKRKSNNEDENTHAHC